MSLQAENPLFSAGLEVQNYFLKKNWPFCFIGGLAVLRWGQLRMTQDIDLCLLCGFGREDIFSSALADDFQSRINKPVEFARQNRVLLLTASNGVAIDISLSGLPFEEEMINRASFFAFTPNCSLFTCSAEDLMVMKAFADRSIDWQDIEGILMQQEKAVDFSYIVAQLTPFCEVKGTTDIIRKLKGLVHKVE